MNIVFLCVVYLLIPTSNHNAFPLKECEELVVYLLIPTSNHNLLLLMMTSTLLYIFWFLHQTTTSALLVEETTKLYIFWFLHQTTTLLGYGNFPERCISFDSYIKPQPMIRKEYIFLCCISFDSYIKPQLKEDWKKLC